MCMECVDAPLHAVSSGAAVGASILPLLLCSVSPFTFFDYNK
jgi:hypothetical protein